MRQVALLVIGGVVGAGVAALVPAGAPSPERESASGADEGIASPPYKDMSAESVAAREFADVGAAVDAVGSAPNEAAARSAARAALAVLGDTDAVLDRVASALPEPSRRIVLLEALPRRVHEDPFGALAAARRLDEPWREVALTRIAREWTSIDPLAAFRAADLLNGRSRARYAAQVIADWTRSDPEDLLDALAERDVDLEDLGQFPLAIVRAYPERILEIAKEQPLSQHRGNLERVARDVLAGRVPRAD